MQINATQLRSGQIIEHGGELYTVLEMTHVTPGKGPALVQSKLRSVRTGVQTEQRFRPADKIEVAYVETQEMQYLYPDATGYVFMNMETFEQTSLQEELFGDDIAYLQPEMVVQVQLHEGRPIGIELPNTVVLEVTETDPPMKGATASGGPKPATTDAGVVVSVPQYIETGTRIVVDTRTGDYVSRAD